MTKEELKQQIIDEVVELVNKKFLENETATSNRPKLSMGQEYWVIRTGMIFMGAVTCYKYTGDETDDFLYKTGLMFPTEQEALDWIERQQIYTELQDIADELNGDWQPDWRDDREGKSSIAFGYLTDTFQVATSYNIRAPYVIYFQDVDDARRTIDQLGTDKLKKLFQIK